ncbi:hypothetical protein ABZW18_10460 [Streptomyces sp. NPDC004647]|uniref:hypothetical protein n=1 Tax=Streptomyces sp. NPDC004647 TaxID=3154671 RepID=UPI0033AF77C1
MADVRGFWERRRASKYERGLWELREGLCSRISELEALLRTKTEQEQVQAPSEVQALAVQAFKELDEARKALHHDHPRRLPAAHLAVAQAHFDVAHSLMLRLSPLDKVSAMMTGLVAYVREHLPVSDERRVQVEQIALSIRAGGVLDDAQREVLVDAMAVARQAHLRESLRVRSFARIVYGVSMVLTVIVLLVGVFGAVSPKTVPLCFQPEGIGVVCPTASEMSDRSQVSRLDVDDLYAMVASRWDYPVVEFIGLVAAAVAAAASLRRIRGTSTPYNVPVALALLKLPTGALTAVLGLLLMRGEFVPGLQSLDSSAQIIAWAVIFGYAQQLFTRFVDNQAQAVLNSVGGPNAVQSKPARDPQVPAT